MTIKLIFIFTVIFAVQRTKAEDTIMAELDNMKPFAKSFNTEANWIKHIVDILDVATTIGCDPLNQFLNSKCKFINTTYLFLN